MQAYFLRLDGVRSQTISVLLLFSFLTLPNLARPAAAWSFSGASKAGQLAVAPASISFGNVPVGTNQTASVVLTNSGGSDLTITAASVSNSAFALSALAYPVTLAAGQTVSCTVMFAPQVGGSTSGNVTVAFTTQSSSGGRKPRSSAIASSVAVSVSGSGATAAQLAANPASLSFGNVPVGSTQTVTQMLTNSGGTSLTVSQATVAGAGFGVTGLSLPMSLSAGQSTTFTVKFTPPSRGSLSGNLSLSSDGSNPNLTVALAGTGILSAGTLSPNPSSLSFGSVAQGNSQTLSETLTNSGASSVTITQANLSGSGFTISSLALPLTLNAGQSTSFTVLFTPQSSGSVSGNLAIVSDASNSTLNLSLSGTGATPATLAANPTSLSFGNVASASSKTLSQTLINSGGSALTISQIVPSGTGFSFTGINPPVTLSAGQSFTFNVTFTPAAAGTVSGSLSITSDASDPNLAIPMSATGIAPGQLALGPTSLGFGNVTVGTSLAKSGTLTATGASVTVSSASVTSPEFALGGISLPITIAAGTSAPFTVTFAPQASGTTSANLTFASNASTTPTVQSLSGSGTAPVAHSVALNWNASTSTNVVGYNVYRGTISGGPYAQLNTALNAGTNDTDTAVQSGHTYYYVVTAVDSSGSESVFSSQVQAAIP